MENNNTQVGVGFLYQNINLSVFQDFYKSAMAQTLQSQDKLAVAGAKSSIVKQSKSVTFKDC